MTFDRGIFVFPWDVLVEGTDRVIGNISSIGCDTLSLSVVYHQNRHLHPRSPGPLTADIPSDGINFRPTKSRFTSAMAPPVNQAIADSDVVLEVRAAADREGLKFDAWIVGLHNSTLGRQYPKLCVTNAFGDRFAFALCPSQPDARAYLLALVDDVCAELGPARVSLESPNYLGWRHGEHHELALPVLCEAAELLLSLCFCAGCMTHARDAGLDADKLRATTKQLALDLIADERGALPDRFTKAELGSLLAEVPELNAFMQVRFDVTSSLLEEVHTCCSRSHVELAVMPSIFAGHHASRAWMEGTSVRRLPAAADQILLLSYVRTVEELEGDISWVRHLAGAHPLLIGLNVGPDTSSDRDLCDKVGMVMGHHAAGVYYYNYGLLTSRRLRWIKQANETLDQRAGMTWRGL